ncbi:hypothetical protein F511_46433 [Dorcoceras hygrometricum]|uniref:Uncharacterized protein n=1 Tax=Dorcoceras hygrometricum TaxID=472368 RepID=A0A2Z6ZTL2_9LAMI|nr:hypothetical protein F511_46433 [Dorcoceras hygrometricum]
MRGQRAWLSRAHVRAAGWKGRRRKRRWRGRNFDSDFVSILKNKMLDTIMAIHIDQIRKNLGSDTTVGDPDPPPGEAAEEQRKGRETINTKKQTIP